MMTVSLKDAEFFAFHGYYAEEQVLGGRYLIDLDVSFEPAHADIGDELDRTVNYERLYNLCCHEMKTPRKLIETVAQSIMDTLKHDYPFAAAITLSIKKMYPPFKGNVHYAAVTLTHTA